MTEKKDGTAAQKAPDGITRKDAVRQALTTLGKDATRAQIHALAAAYGVRTLRSGSPSKDCKYCQAA